MKGSGFSHTEKNMLKGTFTYMHTYVHEPAVLAEKEQKKKKERNRQEKHEKKKRRGDKKEDKDMKIKQ